MAVFVEAVLRSDEVWKSSIKFLMSESSLSTFSVESLQVFSESTIALFVRVRFVACSFVSVSRKALIESWEY